MKPHILVIEDAASLVELLRYNLEKEGYRVSAANDGEVFKKWRGIIANSNR